MQFVHPNFLWALTLISIPVIVHLFHFRRYKRMPFTNVAFLKELQKETRSYQKLRNLLVLLSRILFTLFLVLAFAQPYIPGNSGAKSGSDEQVYLYIDNSFSMEAVSGDGPLLEIAKNKGRNIVKSYGSSQKFFLLTNSDMDIGLPMSQGEALLAIDQIEPHRVQIDAEELIERVLYRKRQSGEYRGSFYWISDFQAHDQKLPASTVQDSSMHLYYLPLAAQQSANLSVDSAWLESPVIQKDKPVQIKIRIKNYGQEDAEGVSLNLVVNEVNLSVLGLDVQAGATVTADMNYTPGTGGWHELMLSVSDRDIYFDDRYYLSLYVNPGVKVLEIKGKAAENYLSKLFDTDPYFQHQSAGEGNIRVSDFEDFDLIILNEVAAPSSGLVENLLAFTRNGGSTFLIPERNSADGINPLCSALGLGEYGLLEKNNTRINKMYSSDPMLAEVFDKMPTNPDFPSIRAYYRIATQTLPLLEVSADQPFLQYQNIEEGKAFQLAVPLNKAFSNFQQHALFVPLVLKMALNRGSSFIPSYTMSSAATLVRGASGMAQLQSKIEVVGNEQRWIPVVQAQGGQSLLDMGSDLSEAGFYRVRYEDSTLQSVALNFDRAESQDRFLQDDEFANIAPGIPSEIWTDNSVPLSKRIEESQLGKRLWKTCITLSLIFLAIEILLLRLWRSRPVQTLTPATKA